MNDNDLIPITKAATKIGVSREYMRQLAKNNEIQYTQIGRFYFIPSYEVKRLMLQRQELGFIRERKSKTGE